MRLRTKLVVAAAGVTFVIVVALSALFLAELLRQRVAQTGANNDLLARQVRMMTAQAVQVGLTDVPPVDGSAEAFQAAVLRAVREHQPLTDTMDTLVRYSPLVEDVSVADAAGKVLVSTDPTLEQKPVPERMGFSEVQRGSVLHEAREVFGRGRLLDVQSPLDRNGKTFLVVHLGIRSSFLRANYVPYLKDAVLLALLGGVVTMLAAAVLASVALRPIEEISRRLESLGAGEPVVEGKDAVVRAAESIDRLGRQMRTTEAGYTDLQANLDQMLDTLRDGVVLFTAERRAAMVSDAVANFVGQSERPKVGQELWEMFSVKTALGVAIRDAFEHEAKVVARTLRLEDGREVEFSLDRIEDRTGRKMGTLLTLRDTGSALRLEQELEVSRRLAAVGRLTAGVGHEVKNPINAMVVHLELLRGKLEVAGRGREFLTPAMRHVEVLAGEMTRLDRVVTTLADFTRPMELSLTEVELVDVVDAVVELTAAEMAEHGVAVSVDAEPVCVRADGEALRQALLNLVLNGMQAMPDGGELRIAVRREQDCGVIVITDKGQGIAPELLPRIFELYFTTKAKGSGIGLAMTYRIAQMHGGTVDVTTEPGAGAQFTLRLPAVAESRRAA